MLLFFGLATQRTNNRSTIMASQEEKIVYINVGGHKYVTTRQTLLNNPDPSYFTALLSDKFEITRDKEGNIFIDRNGKYFEYILDYLRTGELNCPHGTRSKVLKEAEYYQININESKPKKYCTLTYSLSNLFGGPSPTLTLVSKIIDQYPTLKANLIAKSLLNIPLERLNEFFEFMEINTYTLENYQILNISSGNFVYYFVYSYYDQ
jgi:hypothetical protein